MDDHKLPQNRDNGNATTVIIEEGQPLESEEQFKAQEQPRNSASDWKAELIPLHRYNTVKARVEVREGQNWRLLDDRDVNTYAERYAAQKVNKDKVKQLLESKVIPEVNPLTEYFKALPSWNNPLEVINKWVAAMNATDPKFTLLFFTKWLVGAVANVFDKRVCRNHLVFILVGPQGASKTYFFRYLVPSELRDYYTESAFDPENKDHLLATTTNFIYNWDDHLSNVTNRKRDELKMAITQNLVKVRRPYGRYEDEAAKVCSFAGSTNEITFLSDSTGNRRFVPIEVRGIDRKELEQLQPSELWGAAYTLYKNGERAYLNDKERELLDKHNSEFEILSPEYEVLARHYDRPDPKDPEAGKWMTNTEILDELKRHTTAKLSSKKMGEALRKMGFVRKYVTRENDKRAWCYHVDELPQSEAFGADNDSNSAPY